MNNNKKIYLGIVITIVSLLLIVSAHFLQVLFKDTDEFWGIERFWMGLKVSNLIVDIVLYLAIFLLIVMVLMWASLLIDKQRRCIVCNKCV